jgi:hypothetical protein
MRRAGRPVAASTVIAVIHEQRPAPAVRCGRITQGVTR